MPTGYDTLSLQVRDALGAKRELALEQSSSFPLGLGSRQLSTNIMLLISL
jgi:hypothetical protein